jgi:hypothetical protein
MFYCVISHSTWKSGATEIINKSLEPREVNDTYSMRPVNELIVTYRFLLGKLPFISYFC